MCAQSCLTLCNPMNCSPPGSSVHGILQARILEWVAISFSRGSSQPRVQHTSLAIKSVNLSEQRCKFCPQKSSMGKRAIKILRQ